MLGIIPARRTLKAKNKKVQNNGVIVDSIWPNSPAEKAGLQPKDTITAIAVTGAANADSLLFGLLHLQINLLVSRWTHGQH